MKHARNEKGIALVMVMAIALIALSIIGTMLFMVTQGTRMSGFFKQYKSAEEASFGVTDMIKDFMAAKGDLELPGLIDIGGGCRCDTNNDTNTPPATTDDNIDTITNARSCRCDKICNSSANWAVCTANDISLDPTVNFDFSDLATGEPIVLGTGQNQYDVFVKIVDAVEGNTEMGGIVTSGQLGGAGVVASNAGIVNPPHSPYLYRLEIQAQKTRERGFAEARKTEKSRLSALYSF